MVRSWVFAVSLLGIATVANAATPVRVFVSNEDSGSISVIDCGTNGVVGMIATGGRPRGLQLSPDNAHLYAALSRPREHEGNFAEGIVEIDIASLSVGRRLAVGSDPEQFAIGVQPPRLYVVNEDAGTASIVQLADGKMLATAVVGIEPEGIAISPDGRWVYVAGETSNTVSVIDTRTSEVISSFLVESRPRAISFTSDGRFAFVTAEVGRAISTIAVDRHELIDTYHFDSAEDRPVGIAIAPDQERVYVAAGRGNRVVVFDFRNERLRMAASIAVGQRPWGVALTPDGRRLYAANGLSNDVSVVDTTSLQTVATIPVGSRPWGIAVSGESCAGVHPKNSIR